MVLLQGCFTRSQAAAAGVGHRAIDEHLRAGRWRSVHNGVLIDRTEGIDADPYQAALATQFRDRGWLDGVALCRATAAALHGFVGVPEDPWVDIVVPRVWMPKHRPTGVRVHRGLTPSEHVVDLAGLPVTSVTWTALTLARVQARVDAVVAADAALRTGRCAVSDLRAGLPLLTGLRGCVQAREVVDLARAETDSPQETRMRMALVDGGLPIPDVNIRLVDDYGQLLVRGEMGYEGLLIWLEYDGFDVHTRRDVFRSDRSRQNWLARRGWYVLRYTDQDLTRGRRRMIEEVLDVRGGAPARIAALPPGRSPEADAARCGFAR